MVAQNVDCASFSLENRGGFFSHAIKPALEYELVTFNHFDAMAIIPRNRLSHEKPQLVQQLQH